MCRIREVLLHICVVCCLVCIGAKILDWYNPYMNFTGHIWWIQAILLVSVISIIVLEVIKKVNFRKK